MRLEELVDIDYQVAENVANIADSVRSVNPKIKTPIKVPAAIIANSGSKFFKCQVIINIERKHHNFRIYSTEEVSPDEYLDMYSNMKK